MSVHTWPTAFLVAVACVGPLAGQTAPVDQRPKAAFAIAISLKQKTVRPNSEVRINVEITNTTDKELIFGVSRPPSYTVEVRDEAGKEAPLTELGRYVRGEKPIERDEKGNPPRYITGSARMVTIAAGATFHDDLVVTQLYDVSKPGTYTIRRQRFDEGTKVIVRSNTLTFVVAN